MRILKVLDLNGPNIWSNLPAIEAWVDLGHFEDFPSHTLPGFNERIYKWLPTMVEHRCTIGERGGFFERLRTGTWLGHVLEHVTLELQSLSHRPVGFGRARETSERGVYKVVMRCESPAFARVCMESARQLILTAVEQKEFDVEAEVARLRSVADTLCLGPSTQAIVSAAQDRNIPSIRLSEGNLVQLGYGKAQRRIWTAETAKTGAIAQAIAQDKELTRQLLLSVGLPVPAGRAVRSKEDAWEAAQELGLPVVVKPQDGNHGRGVSIRMETEEAILTAYQIAAKEGTGVIVERHIPGRHYRVLVVGDQAVAASAGEADQIVADGTHTVEQLVESANRDPQRGWNHFQPLTTLQIDDISLELLRRQGLTPSSVPEAGRTVLIHHNGDLVVDETDRLHPEVGASCVLAAQTIGLDIAGIDLVTEDIAQPLERQGGAIIEVNAAPALVGHLKPLVGKPRPVGEAIVNHLFKEKETGRVPMCVVSGTNGKTPVAALVAAMLTAAGRAVGQADSTGVRVRGKVVTENDGANAESARRLLMNPFVDAFVIETDERSVLDAGIPFDACDVAVITNLADADHLGKKYVDQPITIAKAVRCALDVVTPDGFGVLNAEDPGVVEMAEQCPGHIIYFGRSPSHEVLAAHVQAGGTAVSIEGGGLVVFRDNQCEYLLQLDRLSCAVLGLPTMFLDNLLAAVAAGIALGLKPNAIRAGVERAVGREGPALFEKAEQIGLVTPARNLSALRAWIETLKQVFPGRRAHAVIEQARDWRQEDADAARSLVSEFFETFSVVAEGDCPPAAGALLSKPTETDTSSEVRSTMTQAVSEKVEALGPSELLFVQTANTTSQSLALACFTEKGMSRRRTSGLASVEHCR